jgi:hypothetical protein
MTTLAANLSDSATELRVNAAVSDPAELYQIDSEIIRVAAVTTTVNGSFSPVRSVDTTLWQIAERGVGTTSAASHLSGATVEPLSPGSTGGGGGGVTVDNTVDAPFSVTTLVALGSTESAPDEATLQPGATITVSPTEPVGIGPNNLWLKTDPNETLQRLQLWVRTPEDDGWFAVGMADSYTVQDVGLGDINTILVDTTTNRVVAEVDLNAEGNVSITGRSPAGAGSPFTKVTLSELGIRVQMELPGGTTTSTDILTGPDDPSAGAGVAASLASTYHRNTGTAGELWVKVGGADTNWQKVTTV